MDKTIDLGKAFTHVFEDSDWLMKGLLGSLISIVPILNFAAIGYELQVVRNVSKGEPRPMPTWDDLGGLFTNGLPLGLAQILLALPMLIPMFIAFGLFFFFPFLIVLLAPALDSSDAGRTMGLVMVVVLLVFFGIMLVSMAYSFVLGFVVPAVTANYARRGTFASCFAAREILDFIRRNFSNYLMVWLAGVLAGLGFSVVYSVTAFIPCLGPLLALPLTVAAVFYIYMVNGHALGQALALDKAPDAPQAVEGAA